MVGLSRTLSQILDLPILHADLPAEELILAFEARDITITVATCRDIRRLVVASRSLSWPFRIDRIALFNGYFMDGLVVTCHDLSRNVATGRRFLRLQIC